MLRVKVVSSPAFSSEELQSFSLEQLRNVCHFLEIKIDFASENKDLYIQKISIHPVVRSGYQSPENYFHGDAIDYLQLPENPRYSVRLQRIIDANDGRIP